MSQKIDAEVHLEPNRISTMELLSMKKLHRRYSAWL